MSDLRQKVISDHIKNHYPDAKIVSYDDPECGLEYYTADTLCDADGDWFPLCSFKDPATGKVVYGGRRGIYHTYTEGETGIGKTTRFVMQSIRALSSMKVKPSFLVVDIHGEIIENLYDHLTEMGYDIRIINCDDPARSDTYNPLACAVEDCVTEERLTDSAVNTAKRIASIIHPVESTKDPIWEKGACAYTHGLILDKLEDAAAGAIPPDCVTLYNVIETHYWLRSILSRQDSCVNRDIFRIEHYRDKGSSALSCQKLIGVTNNSDKTQSSYFGVVENQYDIFGQPLFYQLSSNSTVSVSDFLEKPTVIVVQTGDTPVGENLISLLVNDIYSAAVRMGKKKRTKRLDRPVQCFLDEFANCNIADKDEFTKMLTTSRKFGMYWHMMLQCDAQLERKFDYNTGKIIRANCTEIFMGSNDYETIVRFAGSCGKKTIESLGSSLSGQLPSLETVELIVPEKLMLTEEGYAYVKSSKHPIMKTYFEAFYNCPEFTSPDDIDAVYPVNSFDYRTTRFTPDDAIPYVSMPEYEALCFITEAGHVKVSELRDRFPLYNVIGIVLSLRRKNLIHPEMSDKELHSSVPVERLPFIRRIARDKLGWDKDSLEDDYFYNGDGNTKKKVRGASSVFTGDGLPAFPFGNADEDGEEYEGEDYVYEDDFLSELIGHVRMNQSKITPDLFDDFTCIPDYLREAMLYFAHVTSEDYDESAAEKYEEEFTHDGCFLYLDIVKEFIKNNDFDTLDKWIVGFRDEFNELKFLGILSPRLCESFKDAFCFFTDTLSVERIYELKDAIGDDDEDEDDDN